MAGTFQQPVTHVPMVPKSQVREPESEVGLNPKANAERQCKDFLSQLAKHDQAAKSLEVDLMIISIIITDRPPVW